MQGQLPRPSDIMSLRIDAGERATLELADIVLSPTRYITAWLRQRGWKLPANRCQTLLHSLHSTQDFPVPMGLCMVLLSAHKRKCWPLEFRVSRTGRCHHAREPLPPQPPSRETPTPPPRAMAGYRSVKKAHTTMSCRC
jgi:hypothetical protein